MYDGLSSSFPASALPSFLSPSSSESKLIIIIIIIMITGVVHTNLQEDWPSLKEHLNKIADKLKT